MTQPVRLRTEIPGRRVRCGSALALVLRYARPSCRAAPAPSPIGAGASFLAGALLMIGLLAGAAQAAVEEPAGYRQDEYRAPVPETLAGAVVVTPAEAHALWSAGEAAFIDVMPRAPKPANLPEGTLWHEKPRLSIPGAVWLPNVGYGGLADVMDAWFRAGLSAASGGDPAHPLVFFCLPECWMSWNAAKRAMSYGYSRVYWMPEGSTGWGDAGYPLEPVEPEPGGQ